MKRCFIFCPSHAGPISLKGLRTTAITTVISTGADLTTTEKHQNDNNNICSLISTVAALTTTAKLQNQQDNINIYAQHIKINILV